MSDVSIRDLSVSFGSVNVLQSLSLEIKSGEFVVLLGPSGCGKSTLLNSVAGLTDISTGELWIDGNNVTWSEPSERGIGMVFQSYALYPNMTVLGNLSFGLKMAGVARNDIESRVQTAARMLQIENLLQRRPAELSGGQRQRVAIGRALVRDVKVFLFDEPLSNLDAKLRNELRIEIKRLHQDLGATMIFVTHDQVEALTLADRIVVLNKGVVQQLDAPETIYGSPANMFVAGFVGSPPMNFVSGAIRNAHGKMTFVGPDGTSLDLSAYPISRPVDGEEASTLGIRPEMCFLDKRPESVGLRCDISLIEKMGVETIGWGSIGSEKFAIRMTGPNTLARGPHHVFFNPAEASVFDATGKRI